MLNSNSKVSIEKIGEFLEKVHFHAVFKMLSGFNYNYEPWNSEVKIKEHLRQLGELTEKIFSFLLIGESVSSSTLDEKYGEGTADAFVECGFAQKDVESIYSSEYCIVSCNDLYLVVNLPYLYRNGKDVDVKVYIGHDSLKLSEYARKEKVGSILDLCAGSGIQGLSLCGCADKVTGVELSPEAYYAAAFNAVLNKQENTYSVFNGDLYEPVKGMTFDYILVNPPFVAVPEDVNYYPICGDGGEDGLDLIKRIVEGFDTHLNNNGRATILLESIGDREMPCVMKYLIETNEKYLINSYLFSRTLIENQSDAIANLTSKLPKNKKSYDELHEEWKEMYKRQNAEFLYALVLEFCKTEKPAMEVINLCGDWCEDDAMEIKPIFEVNNLPETLYQVRVNQQPVATINDEMLDILQRKDVFTLNALVSEYSESRVRAKKTAEILEFCMVMEKYGIIKRKKC